MPIPIKLIFAAILLSLLTSQVLAESTLTKQQEKIVEHLKSLPTIKQRLDQLEMTIGHSSIDSKTVQEMITATCGEPATCQHVNDRIRAYLLLAITHVTDDRVKSTAFLQLAAQSEPELDNLKDRLDWTSRIANLAVELEQPDLAITRPLELLKEAEKSRSLNLESLALEMMAQIALNCECDDAAVELMLRARVSATKGGLLLRAASQSFFLAKRYEQLSNPEGSRSETRKILDYLSQLEARDSNSKDKSDAKIANLSQHAQRRLALLESDIEKKGKGLRQLLTEEDNYFQGSTKIFYARNLLKRGKTPEAIEYFEEGISQMHDLSSLSFAAQIDLAEIDQKKGNLASAKQRVDSVLTATRVGTRTRLRALALRVNLLHELEQYEDVADCLNDLRLIREDQDDKIRTMKNAFSVAWSSYRQNEYNRLVQLEQQKASATLTRKKREYFRNLSILAGIGSVLAAIFWTRMSFRQQLQLATEKSVRDLNATLEQQLELKTADLRTQKQRLQTICDNAYGTVYEADENGKISFVAGSLHEDLGYSDEDIIGHHQLKFVASMERRTLFRDAKMSDGEFKYDRELQISQRDGNLRWVRLSGGTIHGPDRKRKWVGAIQDIHSQVLHRQKAIEVSRLQSLGTICGGLAHDFNNLLTVIGIQGEMIDDESIRSAVLKAQSQASDLTTALLTFARKQEFRDKTIDIVKFLEESKPLIERIVPASVRCSWNIMCQSAIVRIDPSQLQQVLINLVTNAQHAMEDHGQLSISCMLSEAAPDSVANRKTELDRSVILSFADTGIGMDQETACKAIDPFFTTKPRGTGTGLGLSTVHGVIKRAGGVLDIRSQPGNGTTVTIYLPHVHGEALPHPGAAQTSEIPRNRHNHRVIVIEDRESVAAAVQKTLERAGYRVSVRSNAEDGMKEICEQPFDLVISDVVLPGMSGIDLIKKLKRDQILTKAILISGNQQQRLDVVGENSESVRFIPKPFAARSLLQTADELLTPCEIS